MGFLKKMLARGWRERAVDGEAHRDGGELGPALQEFRAAIAKFDGTPEELEQLESMAASCRVGLREQSLVQAQTHAAAGAWEEALLAVGTALDHSVTAEERRDVNLARRVLDDQLGSAGLPDGGGWRSINYLVTSLHSYTMLGFLKGFGRPLAQTIGVLHYEDLPAVNQLPGGTYIFSDLERLGDAQLAMLESLWNTLDKAEADLRLLNHPTRAMDRYELLRTLHDRGENRFDVYRLGEEPRPLRRPVFLRHADEHEGSFSGVVGDEAELDAAVARAVVSGWEPEDLLVVEYCETADRSGLYRKYAAFRVGDRILPRHLIHSRQWMLKLPDLIDAELLDEDRRYVTENPHEQRLREIFELAHIDYGRIDYGVVDDEIQVWEINTNPIVMAPPERYREPMLPAQERFAPMIIDAFRAIGPGPGPGARGTIDLISDRELTRSLLDGPSER